MSGPLARPPKVWYNDNDPFCVLWLKNLLTAGHLPIGDVDDRPIQEIQASDLAGYDQCHFFAGIGGWPYAMQRAGWDGPLWTGSCPCQPFSAAGKRGSHADDRHLWPVWFDLIRKCHPVTVVGEQVSGAAGLGWLDAVALDLETLDYAVGACVLGAHSVGAPHLRQRLYFVADAENTDGRAGDGPAEAGVGANGERGERPESGRPLSELGEPERAGLEGHARAGTRGGESGRKRTASRGPATPASAVSELADPERRSTERRGHDVGDQAGGAQDEARERERLWLDPWTGCEFIPCRDGKARPVEPGTFPLAHGIPGRMGRLRAYGNAIVPQVGASFLRAVQDLT